MRPRLSFFARAALAVAAVAAASVSTGAQAGRGAAPAPGVDPLVRQVRTALGHGAVEDAQRLVEAASGAGAGKELATALVEEFRGKDDQALTRLKPLADADRLGEAALEYALLEMRRGQRDDGRRILNQISTQLVGQFNAQRSLASPDDYFRLARAARGNLEFLLANDAYQRVVNVPRADVQTEWGDMLLQRQTLDLALQSYQAAIKADPSWVPAHLGVARVLADENPEAAAAALETARKLAPNDPRLWLLVAERSLAGEDPAAAGQALDRLAAVRPGSIDEAAWRAAVAYAAKRPATEVDGWIAKVHDIDARSALGYRVLAAQVAQAYRSDDAVEIIRKGTTLDPDDPLAHFDFGMYLLRAGDEKTARTELERAWALDNSNRVNKNLLNMLDSLATFEVVPDGDLIFKFPKAEAAVLKAYALPLGREAMKTFTEHYGFTPKGPILVEVFNIHDEFAVRTIGLAGISGALGACFGRVVSMDSPHAHPKIDFSWQATLWHELAHVFTLQLSDYRVPRWLTEGTSVYEEHRRNPAWGRELNLEFARVLSHGKTFGVKKLPEAFKHPETLSLAYFEASLVVEHLVELNGDAGLRTLLKAYAAGDSDADAFSKAFGKSMDDVEASFARWVDQHYGALRDAMKDPPSQPGDVAGLRARAAAAPGNYISQLTFGQQLVKDGDAAGARTTLERAAQLAPQAMGDSSPHFLLAQLALQQGDQARARSELRALLTYDHANLDAARQLASLATQAKALDDEDFGLRLVADLDPFDAEAHGTLGKREVARGNLPAALIEFQATLALGPTNLAEAHADVAEVFLKMNRRDEARREALLALQEAPTYARAQDLLLAAIGREPAGR